MVFMLAGGATLEPEAPTVNRVSFTTIGRTQVVRLHVTGHVSGHSSPRLTPAGRTEITLFRTELGSNKVLDNPKLPIESYEINQVQNDVILLLDVDKNVVDVEAYRDRDSNDILVAVKPKGEGGTAIPAGESPSTERWTLDTVVIDAGHGGKDSGAVARTGLKEKDVVLAVALQVGEYLKTNLGINVVYTRNKDEFISLSNRGHMANQAEGKLFVSIHANSAPDSRASGTETFFLGLHKSEAAKRVMDRENEVIRFEEDQSKYEGIDARLAVMQTLAQSAYMRQSQFLADLVEDQFESRVGRKSRGVKQAGFYVLYGASMPSILVELGFISNYNEAAFMGSQEGQTYLASAIYRAIRDYKVEYDKGLQLSTTSGK